MVQIDRFDANTSWVFDTGRLADGSIELIGLGGRDWSGFFHKENFLEGNRITVNFLYTQGAEFEFFFDQGQWFTDSYKRFGSYVDNNLVRPNLWAGRNALRGAIVNGNFMPQSGTIYSLSMALLPDGGFLAAVWDPSDTSKVISYYENIGNNWSNLNWIFHIQANSGIILFDDFTRIEFDNIRPTVQLPVERELLMSKDF